MSAFQVQRCGGRLLAYRLGIHRIVYRTQFERLKRRKAAAKGLHHPITDAHHDIHSRVCTPLALLASELSQLVRRGVDIRVYPRDIDGIAGRHQGMAQQRQSFEKTDHGVIAVKAASTGSAQTMPQRPMQVQTAAQIIRQRKTAAIFRPGSQTPYPFRHLSVKDAAAYDLQQVYIGTPMVPVAQYVHEDPLGTAAVQRPGDKQDFLALMCHNVQRYEFLHNATKTKKLAKYLAGPKKVLNFALAKRRDSSAG